MENSLKRILDEFNSLKGPYVLNECNEVMRLIAIGDDQEDYYYILYDGKRTYWCTCVGWIAQLKNKIDDKAYERLLRSARLNHYDQITYFGNKDPEHQELKKFNEEHKKSILTDLLPNHTYLTELCCDLI